jgi:hypothetical protein
MFQLLDKLETISSSKLTTAIVFISVLVAAQVQYIQHGWINPDSILYFESAKLFAIGEWKAGFEIFPWPLYSLCISATHIITSLNIHQSAQLLNVLFFTLSTFAFIKIIKQCGGKQKEMIAGALIFLSAPYMVGTALEMLMRDEGFWAFFLLSLLCFIRFYQHQKLPDALIWQIAMIIATLFRIEAILYLTLLPLTFCFESSTTTAIKIRLIIKAYCIQIAICVSIIAALVLNDHFSTAMLGRLNEIFTPELIHNFTKLLTSKSQVMSEQVLGKFLNEYALPGLILTLIYAILIKTINATGLINIVLAALAIKQRRDLIDRKSFTVLVSTGLIATINMALIITKVFVLSGRYVLALSFVLMVFSSFYLANLIQKLNTQPRWTLRALVGVIGLVMCLTLIKNILPKKDGYNYMQDAITWLKEQNTSNAPIYYNEARLRYFAGEPYIGKWDDNLAVLKEALDSNEISNYDILVLAISNTQINQDGLPDKRLTNYREIHRFSDPKKRKHVIIYKKYGLST